MSVNNVINVTLQDTGTASGEESAGEMIWPAPTFNKYLKCASNIPQIRKKRVHSASFSHSGTNGLTIDGIPSDLHTLTAAIHRVQLGRTRLPYSKNSRKSRDGGGRNQDPSKDELDEIELDPDDPDYDSDVDMPVTFDEVHPILTDEGFEKLFTIVLREFFEHGKTQEVIEALSDVNISSCQRRRIVYLAIVLAIEHKQTQCVLTSELFSDMYGKVLSHAHIQQGFQLILNELGDLVIDVPKAHEYVARFIARAIADDILPPKFVERQRSVFSQILIESPTHIDVLSDTNGINTQSVFQTSSIANVLNDGNRPVVRNLSDSSTGGMTIIDTSSSGIGSISSLTLPTAVCSDIALKALSRADTLLTLRHAFARLDNIWGVPAGPRTIKILIKKIRLLLKSFLDTGDIDDATQALLELDSPHFHHELVYQGVILLIELSTDKARDAIIRLLNELCHSVVLTFDQLTCGIRRVHSELADLQIDVPNAYVLMERFMRSAIKVGFMPKKLVEEIPSKHRKRFISETDSFYRTDDTYW